MTDFSGKKVLVLGGSRGIGARAARGNASNARAGTIARAVLVAAAIARRFTGEGGNP